ncbi:MAG: hypothetical protein QXP31_03280 [Pyrobaculum sp.]
MIVPKVDPCIFLHYDWRDWEPLLGGQFVDELLKRFRHVAGSLPELVEFFKESPSVVYLGLRGLRVGGRYKREWLAFAEGGYVSPEYRARWPYVENDFEIGARLHVSPCYLLTALTSYDRAYVWRNRASALFKWVEEVPRRRPWEVFREAFPSWIRELARERGYAWVAWTRWRDRRNRHLAEWLYWLDTGRLPHIDIMLGRYNPPNCTKNRAGGVLYNSA